LGDHGPFMGAQLGVSKEGGLFDPLTGQSMTAEKLKALDLNNGDPVAREKAINLSMAQQLFGQGYVTPRDNLSYGAHGFKSFTEPMRNQCTSNLQTLLSQMTRINVNGCGCGMRLPNHLDGDKDIMLQSFGRLPKPYACPTLSAVYNPMLANAMPEGAACKTIGQYMQQKGIHAVSIQDLQRIANDKNAPPMVRNACAWMDQHRNAFDRIEQLDVPNQKDNWSGSGNFLNRANQLGANDWTPIMTPLKVDFFFNRRGLFGA
jgi:hypothetical protein